jgi:hypothetical protein
VNEWLEESTTLSKEVSSPLKRKYEDVEIPKGSCRKGKSTVRVL